MTQNNIVIQIAGASGEGAISAGDVLSQATARVGLNVTTHRVYPAEIRGGGSTMFQLRISSEEIWTIGEESDILLALCQNALETNYDIVKKGGYIFYDESESCEESARNISDTVNKIAVPFSKISKEINAPKAKNIIALGVFTGLIKQVNYEDQLKKDITKRFQKKGEEILNANLQALEEGIRFAREKLSHIDFSYIELTPSPGGKLVMTGNEAIAIGSLVAGCKFYA